MSRRKSRAVRRSDARPLPPRQVPHWRFALLALAVVVFYWAPLTNDDTTIQWDAVDVHYTSQKYFAQQVGNGTLPFWTPYIFSGFPFLADPQTGAWYPLNWPFFIFGVTPRSIQFEIFVHALLACAGAYLLARRLLAEADSALAAALCYGLSGFFAAHSSHVGMFQTAAWLPWLLLGYMGAVESRNRRVLALTTLAGGLMILAGHFQTALYAFSALALFAVSVALRSPGVRGRCAITLVLIGTGAVLISAIQTLPTLELTVHSIRAGMNTSLSRDGALPLKALATLVSPNHLNALSGIYTGPPDVTQYYFYAGIFLIPLAILGCRNRAVRWPAAVLLVSALGYALGPAAGLSRIAALLPGFRSVRAPVHAWFVAALALSLLAAGGVELLTKRFRYGFVPLVILSILFIDVFYWNSVRNPLAYGRFSYQSLYGHRQDFFQSRVAAKQPAGTRFHSPQGVVALGPLNAPLDVGVEATYGYNPLELAAYRDYMEAATNDTKLLAGLNVTRRLTVELAAIEPIHDTLPRFTFPKTLVTVAAASSAWRHPAHDPAREAIVVDSLPGVVQDDSATVEQLSFGQMSYRVRYRSGAESLLRAAIPYFPGWRATVDGKKCRIVPVDRALMGVVVPPGAHELNLEFRSNYFGTGAAISLATVALLILLIRMRTSPKTLVRVY